MKKNSVLSFIITYILIVFLVIGLNILLYLPVNNIIKSSNDIQSKYETQITNLGSDNTAVGIYSNYIEEIQENYGNYFRVFTNMIITLYVVISLSLVIVGLSLRVNTNRNKGMYNAVIAAGITTILYLIWFILYVPGIVGILF